jgi:hypothetical protein
LLKTYGASAAAVRKNLVQMVFDLGANKIKLYVHKKAVSAYESACADYRSKVKTGKAKAYTFKAAYCGSFNWRNIKRANGTTSPNLSMHSFGIAVDFNSWNPNGQGKSAKSDIPAELVKSMNKYGIYWGGDWSGSTRDPMHFELLPSGIKEAATPAKKPEAFKSYTVKVMAIDGLRVRKIASTKSDTVKKLKHGVKVTVTGKVTGEKIKGNSTWLKVSGGYISEYYTAK